MLVVCMCLAVFVVASTVLARCIVKRYGVPTYNQYYKDSKTPPPKSVREFEKLAETISPKNHWMFYSSGTGMELTLKDNVAAYDRYLIRPRYLRDVSNVDMRVTLFGDEIDFPISTSPTGFYSQSPNHEGELDFARACSDLGTCMVLSDFAGVKMEDVSKAFHSGKLKGTIWYNIQHTGASDQVFKEHIRRAEVANFKALVITIDQPVSGNKKKLVSQTFIGSMKFPNHGLLDGSLLKDYYLKNLADPSVTWDRIDWVRCLTRLPIILKGIMTAEDAREAVKHDIQGIIVSNHGGRQLDGVPATIDVLSEVVSAVDNKVDVFIDGGIRKGTDVLKALALGAKAVFIGRPAIWGLEYNGFEGVKSVLTILRDELKLAMQLSGCANLSDLRKNNVVVHESHYRGGCHGRRNET